MQTKKENWNFLGLPYRHKNIFGKIYRNLALKGQKNAARGFKTLEIENFNYILPRYVRFPNFLVRKLSLKYIKHEFLWYLKGDKFDTHISIYAKMWKELINKDGSINSNYGQYIFGQEKQFDNVLKILKNDKNSRRASMVILNKKQLFSESKDIPCLAGETLIRSPEGDITIRELSNNFKKGLLQYPIYSFNENTRDIEIQYCSNAWKSGHKQMLKITFDDGSILRCTPDHRIYCKVKKNRVTHIDVKIASNFNIGERVWATHFMITPKGYQVYIKNLSENWSYNNQMPVHAEYNKFLNGTLQRPDVIHHINNNKLDNRKDNLLRIHKSEHDKLKMLGANNPMKHETKQANIQRRSKLKKTIRQLGVDNFGWGLYHKNKKITNHTITNIETCISDDVYDFTCENNHNAVVGTGIIVHNCTYSINFRIRQDTLNMTVRMRSQDAMYGMGNDAPSFSFVHEMMFNALKEFYPSLKYGQYYHSADSFHVYEKHFEMLEKITGISILEPTKKIKQESDFELVLCPQISGPEEVQYLRKLNFENIPINFKFSKWLNDK